VAMQFRGQLRAYNTKGPTTHGREYLGTTSKLSVTRCCYCNICLFYIV